MFIVIDICKWRRDVVGNMSENIPFDICAQRKFRPAYTFAQPGQHFGLARMQRFFIRTTETLVRLRGCADLFESLFLGAHVRQFVFSRCVSYFLPITCELPIRCPRKPWVHLQALEICTFDIAELSRNSGHQWKLNVHVHLMFCQVNYFFLLLSSLTLSALRTKTNTSTNRDSGERARNEPSHQDLFRHLVFGFWLTPLSAIMNTFVYKGFSQTNKNRMANTVDPGETARSPPSHLIYTVCTGICIGLQD